VVPSSFPIDGDGILGKPFLKENKISIDVEREVITYPEDTLTTIPSRSEVIIPIRVSAELEAKSCKILTHTQNINEHIVCGNVLNTIKQEQLLITVINPTKTTQIINVPKLNELSHDILETVPIRYIQSHGTPNNANNRIQLLKENLRCDHINQEENESIVRLCTEFSEIFFLEGDKLSCTDQFSTR